MEQKETRISKETDRDNNLTRQVRSSKKRFVPTHVEGIEYPPPGQGTALEHVRNMPAFGVGGSISSEVSANLNPQKTKRQAFETDLSLFGDKNKIDAQIKDGMAIYNERATKKRRLEYEQDRSSSSTLQNAILEADMQTEASPAVLEQQQLEVSFSQTTLDRSWPLTKRDELYKRIDSVSRSFTRICTENIVNGEEAKTFLKSCRSALTDMKFATDPTSYETSRQKLVDYCHEGGKPDAYENDRNVKKVVNSLRDKLVEQGIITEDVQEGPSSSRTTLDRSWPLDKNDELCKRIDNVSRAFGNICGKNPINDEKAKAFLKSCKSALTDMRIATNPTSYETSRQKLVDCYREGNNLVSYKNDRNVQKVVDFFKTRLEEQEFVTRADINEQSFIPYVEH